MSDSSSTVTNSREVLARALFTTREQAGDWDTGSQKMRDHWLAYADSVLAAGYVPAQSVIRVWHPMQQTPVLVGMSREQLAGVIAELRGQYTYRGWAEEFAQQLEDAMAPEAGG